MWYVIQTEPGLEETVKREIQSRAHGGSFDDCRILYCVRKKRYLGAWHEERARFLPGYLFVVTKIQGLIFNEWNAMLETEEIFGCSRVICPVLCEEEEFLMKLTGGRNEIGMSYGVIRDGVLKVIQGELTGMEPRVKKIDRHKRKGYISMRIHGEEKLAELGLEITEKTNKIVEGTR